MPEYLGRLSRINPDLFRAALNLEGGVEQTEVEPLAGIDILADRALGLGRDQILHALVDNHFLFQGLARSGGKKLDSSYLTLTAADQYVGEVLYPFIFNSYGQFNLISPVRSLGIDQLQIELRADAANLGRGISG